MHQWSRKAAIFLFFLIGRPVLSAAPVPPPRKIDVRLPQLHLLDRD
jgi:hypothetical protein